MIDGYIDLEPVALTELGLFLNGTSGVVAVAALAVAVMFTIGWLAPARNLRPRQSKWANFLLAGTFWFMSFEWAFDAAAQGLVRFSLSDPQGAERLFIWGAIFSRGVFCLFAVSFVVFALRVALSKRRRD